MKRLLAAAFALSLAACAHAQPADPTRQTFEEVAAAERAFAAHALEVGIAQSFRDYAAPDAVVFRPDPVNLHEDLKDKPSRKGPPYLRWWPVHGGAALSGDLAFDTGPSIFEGEKPRYGWFFTVWKRQPDGGWKWVLDHGLSTPEASTLGPESAPTSVAAGVRGAGGADGFAEVRTEEARLGEALAAGRREAFRALLADDAWLATEGRQPASGSALDAALAARPAALATEALGGGASAAGDLAYTWGKVRWREGDAEKWGQYVRIWRRSPEGWRVVFDKFTPA